MKIFNKKLLVMGLGAAMLLSCVAHVEPESRNDSSSANSRVIVSGNIQYSYERSPNIKFDFVQRQNPFTSREIKSIQDALDKLPDAFLEKVISSGVTKFYRIAKVPRKNSDIFTSAGDETAVAVPPRGFIAFADSAFNRDHADVYKILIHQAAHCVAWKKAGGNPFGATAFTWISWTGDKEPFGRKSFNGFVSDYGSTNPREDYAETCVYYWLAPDNLQKINPEKFAYMRDKVFETISPPDARQELPSPIHVQPVITSLSSASDEIDSLVIIKGKYFMGPFDGGYNIVRFGGLQANHGAVSNTTMYAWVPDVSEGNHPITVTTQDGVSNAVPFTVETPWWKFW